MWYIYIYISFFFVLEKQTQMGEGWGSKTMDGVLQFHTICRVVFNWKKKNGEGRWIYGTICCVQNHQDI